MELSPTFYTTPRFPPGPGSPRVPGLTQIPGLAHTTITEDWTRCPISPVFYIQQVPPSQYICPSLPSEVMGNMPLPSPSHVQQLSAPQPFSDVGEVISNVQFPETAFQHMHHFALVPHVQQLPSPQSSAVGLPPSPKMVSSGLGSA